MKRSLVLLAVAALAASAAFFYPDVGHTLMTAAGLAVLGSVYALPARVVALIIFRMSGTARRRGMAGEIETGSNAEVIALIKELGVKATETKKEVQDMAKEALAKAKEGITMTEGVKESVDKKMSEQGALVTEINQQVDALLKRIGDGAGAPQAKSIGRQVGESQALKDFVAAGGFKAVGQALNVSVKEISQLTGAAGGVTVFSDRRPEIMTAPLRRMTVRDLLMPGRTSTNLIEFLRELVFTNNAAPVSETILKPESNITFEEASAPVRTIAHWIKASKQIIDDVPAMESFIDGRLRYGLMLVEEAQLLKGSGAGNNLNGIYTQATTYALPSGATAVTTRIDTIRMMMLQAELAEYPVTGIVLHPTDWANIEVAKESTGRYLWANPTTTNGSRLWGRDVVATQAMTVDTALVGAFRMGAQIFDREDANVVLSSENSDDFVKNRVTIRAEERLALAVYRPAAFVKNTNLPAG